MTAEEAIAAIAKEMKSQVSDETYLVSDRNNMLFQRARSYRKISHIIEEVIGEEIGVRPVNR